MSASSGQELMFLSDLHMGAGDALDPFAEDDALVALLDELAEAGGSGGPARRLVLLGDTFDLVLADVAGEGPLRALERIAEAHPRVFAALRRLAASGVDVEVVAGNHDIELVRPEVRRALDILLPGVAVQPWLVYVPGLVLAEHGQQHHAINRFRALGPLATGRGSGVGPLPPARHLDALDARRAAGRGLVSHAAAVLRAGPRLATGLIRTGARRPLGDADAWSLPRKVLSELDAAAAAGARADARRLCRAILRRPGTPSGFAAMLPGAAARVHRILAHRDAAVPYLVFGHTHLAADIPLAAPGPRCRYLNCGAWVPVGDHPPDRTLVTVGRNAAGIPYARVERWDPARRARRSAA